MEKGKGHGGKWHYITLRFTNRSIRVLYYFYSFTLITVLYTKCDCNNYFPQFNIQVDIDQLTFRLVIQIMYHKCVFFLTEIYV